MKILKKIIAIKKIKISTLLSHPLMLLILGSLVFSSTIAKYNNVSSVDMAVVNAGLIPASKAYLDCRADLQATLDYYEFLRVSLLENERLSNNDSSFSLYIKQNSLKGDALERKINFDCENIYEILKAQADFLDIDKNFAAIVRERAQHIRIAQEEKLNVEARVSMIRRDLPHQNLLKSYAEYGKAIVELQFLLMRKSNDEMKFYQQATGLFKERVKENMHKKIWSFLF
jgi:hypothetical protein